MKYLIEDFFDLFKCIGGACTNTCCAGWRIDVDSETAEAYRAVNGEMGEKLKEHLIFNENDAYIKLTDKGECPFLTEERLCEIYQKLGEEMQCLVCKMYPRILERREGVFFALLTCSCPEVVRMLLERREPLQFIEWDDGEDWSEMIGGHKREGGGQERSPFMDRLGVSVRILQERRYPLSVRLRLLLLFTDTLQQRMDEGKEAGDILEHFSSPDAYGEYARALSAVPENIPARLSAFNVCLKNYEKLAGDSPLTRTWRSLKVDLHSVDYLLALESPEYDIQYEHYAVYQMHRFYMREMDAGKPMRYAAVLIYTLNLLKCMAAMCFDPDTGILPRDEQIRIFCEVSSNFDHCREHVALLYDIYGEKAGDIRFLTSLT